MEFTLERFLDPAQYTDDKSLVNCMVASVRSRLFSPSSALVVSAALVTVEGYDPGITRTFGEGVQRLDLKNGGTCGGSMSGSCVEPLPPEMGAFHYLEHCCVDSIRVRATAVGTFITFGATRRYRGLSANQAVIMVGVEASSALVDPFGDMQKAISDGLEFSNVRIQAIAAGYNS